MATVEQVSEVREADGLHAGLGERALFDDEDEESFLELALVFCGEVLEEREEEVDGDATQRRHRHGASAEGKEAEQHVFLAECVAQRPVLRLEPRQLGDDEEEDLP